MDALPELRDELPPQALRVLSRATVLHTMHAGRRTVWHRWGEGEPLVLLHGGSGSWTHWVRNVEPLAASGRAVLVPDIPGFGDSDVAEGATDADGVLGPLAAGLRELGGGAPLDIVGFSFGGMVSVLIAAREPTIARRLVLVAPPGLGLRAQRLPLKPWLGLTDPVAVHEAHRSNLATLMLHDPQAIDALALAVHSANLRRDRMRGRKMALTDVVARTLPALACPLDAILGENDALYREDLPAFEAAVGPRTRLGHVRVIPGAGHWVQYEAAEAFNAVLLETLRT